MAANVIVRYRSSRVSVSHRSPAIPRFYSADSERNPGNSDQWQVDREFHLTSCRVLNADIDVEPAQKNIRYYYHEGDRCYVNKCVVEGGHRCCGQTNRATYHSKS